MQGLLCPDGYIPHPPGEGSLAVSGQGRGIDGQINIPPLGLIKPRNLCPIRRGWRTRGCGPWQGVLAASGAWGVAAGPEAGAQEAWVLTSPPLLGITFLPGLRGGLRTIFLAGMVGIKPKTP